MKRKSDSIVRSYKYRLYCRETTNRKATHFIKILSALYNITLEQKIYAYKHCSKSLNVLNQKKEFHHTDWSGTILENRLDYPSTAYKLLFDRIRNAYNGFFKLNRGYPKHKRINSFSLDYSGGFSIGNVKIGTIYKKEIIPDTGVIRINGIGSFSINEWNTYKPASGRIRKITITKDNTGKWWVSFTVDNTVYKEIPVPETNKSVGIDVGKRFFATFSDGTVIKNPKINEKLKRKIRILRRKLARQKRGSRKYYNTRKILAKLLKHQRNQRLNFHHIVANQIIAKYNHISVEDLDIKEMKNTDRDKRIKKKKISREAEKKQNFGTDQVAWGQFLQILEYKSKQAGRVFVRVPPEYTTQECNSCGQLIKKTLWQRQHNCECGFNVDRDFNASLNIKRRGLLMTA